MLHDGSSIGNLCAYKEVPVAVGIWFIVLVVLRRRRSGKSASNHSMVTAMKIAIPVSDKARKSKSKYQIEDIILPGWRCKLLYLTSYADTEDEIK